MEGLIKGLADVIIGHHDRRDDDEDNGTDERSRSTRTEVVSGEQENNEDYSRNSNRRNEEGIHGRKEESEHVESRPSMRPQKTVNEGYERDERRQDDYNKNRHDQHIGEESNDGWETVGKNPRRTHHKVHKDNWYNFKRPANEQEYSNEVSHNSQLEPSENELNDLAQACNKLWDLDCNRLTPGKDYEIDCGEGKKSYETQDMAAGSLFTWLSDEIFKKPTFSRFCSLLDNYNPHEGYKEQITCEEKQEQDAFIEEISRTAPIKYLYKYLSLNLKGIISEDCQEFKSVLTSLWFDLYGRGGTSSCSSAFEHVFVGEIKNRDEQSVSGFHNWLQFYMEEEKGRVDYQGYIFPRKRGHTPDSETQLLTIQYEWNGVLKSVSSTLIGVSPEFEIALYTLCFFAGNEENRVELGPYSVNIKCYRLGNKLGSAFPVAES